MSSYKTLQGFGGVKFELMRLSFKGRAGAPEALRSRALGWSAAEPHTINGWAGGKQIPLRGCYERL